MIGVVENVVQDVVQVAVQDVVQLVTGLPQPPTGYEWLETASGEAISDANDEIITIRMQ